MRIMPGWAIEAEARCTCWDYDRTKMRSIMNKTMCVFRRSICLRECNHLNRTFDAQYPPCTSTLRIQYSLPISDLILRNETIPHPPALTTRQAIIPLPVGRKRPATEPERPPCRFPLLNSANAAHVQIPVPLDNEYYETFMPMPNGFTGWK